MTSIETSIVNEDPYCEQKLILLKEYRSVLFCIVLDLKYGHFEKNDRTNLINITWADMTIYMNQVDSNEDAKHFDIDQNIYEFS